MRVSLGGGIDITSKPFLLDRAQAGFMFERTTFRAGGVGNQTGIQVHNPAGSGVTSIVVKTHVATDTAQDLILNFHDTALTTLSGTLFNLDRNGAASACQLRNQIAAAPFGSVNLKSFRILAGHVREFDVFYVLGPGEGLVWTTQTVNTTLYAGFMVWEF